ncbi:hypothetical protein SCHPADRAFT_615062 [Schizopora paradoxa]|uniref:Uncharacterized protein n=1 Tax=Schizopora paradoxa TaxID=27342 RepID=A0A0H2RA68_9AGAM|nr:hypothetical protein SCHPADRAFT_615062 [Schizopora paradoxa]
MDSDGIYGDDAEASLRTHVRSILHDYILEHLTVDQAQYTSDLVSDFISNLTNIPNHEPSSLALPVEPLDSLRTTLKLDSLKPFEESFAVDGETVSYLKLHLLGKKSNPKTQRIWDETLGLDGDYRYMEEFTPVLSRESRRNTPHIAKKKPKTFAKFFLTRPLPQVEVIEVTEKNTLDKETCLDTKFSMDSATLSSIVAMHKDNPFLDRRANERKLLRGSAKEFLSQTSPIKNLDHLQPISPPLFTRRKRQKQDANTIIIGGAKTMGEATASFHPVEIENMDLDVPKENMKIVDGWTAIDTSSQTSRTPSLSSGVSEVDELDDMWLPTSDADPMAPIVAADLKMDEYQMPRQKRAICGGASSKDESAFTKSLHSFMSKFAPKIVSVPSSDDIALAPPHSQATPSSPVALSSMLGQPGSDPENDATTSAAGNGPLLKSRDRLTADLNLVLSNTNTTHRRFQDVIMHERLDDADAAVYMDVPHLPPAHEFVKSRVRSMDLKSLVHDEAIADPTEKPTYRLEVVSGVKSLNLELSWRPFNYGKTKPTHDEMLDVQVPFSFQEIDILDPTDKSKLNNLLIGLDSDPPPNVDIILRFILEDEECYPMAEPTQELGILLNRTERRRQKKYQKRQEINSLEQDLSELSHQDIVTAEALAILDTRSAESPYPYPLTGWQLNQVDDATFDGNTEMSFRQLMRPDEVYYEDSLSTLDDLDLQPVSHKPAEDFLGYASNIPDDDDDLALYEELDANDADFNSRLPVDNINFNNTAEFNFIPPPQTDLPFELESTAAVAPTNSPQIHYAQQTDKRSSTKERFLNGSLQETRPLVHPSTKPVSSVGLLCDRSSVRTSLFVAMRRGNALCLGSHSSPPRPSSKEADTSEAREQDIVETMTRELPPPEIQDDPSYLRPPSPWMLPNDYIVCMISMDVLQKRALVKALESELCNIRPIGRTSLDIVDVIVDPSSALLFFPLSALPSQCDVLSARTCKASWHFDQLVVVLEAFPSSLCYKTTKSERIIPFAYGPPVLKAVKRLRRDILLREGLGEKNSSCAIQFAFANSVGEAAILSRIVADSSTNNGTKVGYMLSEEELEGEDELGSMMRLNTFAANVILRHCSLNDFLEMPEGVRQTTFGSLVGPSRIEQCNAILSMRLAQMERLQSSSDSDSGLNNCYSTTAS